jgi:hypothetical protein
MQNDDYIWKSNNLPRDSQSISSIRPESYMAEQIIFAGAGACGAADPPTLTIFWSSTVEGELLIRATLVSANSLPDNCPRFCRTAVVPTSPGAGLYLRSTTVPAKTPSKQLNAAVSTAASMATWFARSYDRRPPARLAEPLARGMAALGATALEARSSGATPGAATPQQRL